MAIPSVRLLYATTIACSSVLLFAVQPIMAKMLLPRFGGSAGVWVACMLFFQVMLLGGYLYSWLLTSLLSRRWQSATHGLLLIASLATIFRQPVVATDGSPVLSILAVLLGSIGLPYFLLSATSPLLQSWFARSNSGALPYRFFAISNAASLAALLAFPVAIEPLLPGSVQLRGWRIGYGVLAFLAVTASMIHAFGADREPDEEFARGERRPLLWIGLAACASTLWMAVANYLSQEVAPVPFLWILPLSIYLLTFILCFEGSGWYRPALVRWLLPVAWILAVSRIAGWGPSGLVWEVSCFSAALFVWCMFCHGEIARTRPADSGGVAWFYLTIALGGAVGAVFVGLIAPGVLHTYLELPIGIAVSVLFALRVMYGVKSSRRLARLALVALVAFVVSTRFAAGLGDTVRFRNFYGALQVSEGTGVRTLYHGKTLHGVEFLAPGEQRLPTAYYGPDSGAGLVLSHKGSGRRVGLVGLGVGTLAAYGRAGDFFRFYEINPAVIDVAHRYFHFLRTSAATIDVKEGDGRLALEKEPANSFDVLVLDAFADDSVPVHLLTREAFALYFRLLKSDGTLAVHITNRYLDLAPVVKAAAVALDKRAVEVHSESDPDRQILAADWMLVGSGPAAARNTNGLWTDDYSNLFQILK